MNTNTTIESGSLSLEPLTTNHITRLLVMRNSEEFLKFCSNRRFKLSLEEFKKEITRDFSFDRHLQYVIKSKGDFAGTIYSYSLNKHDGYVFITIYIEPEFRKSLVAFKAFALMCRKLFSTLVDLNKIYVDVYNYNQASLKPLLKIGFTKEGEFKEHRFFEGNRYSVIRLAFYRRQMNDVSRFLDKL